jgi:CHAT domain-containing protein
LLYRKTNNQKFIDDIFYFVELTKYLNILDALQRAERANNSDVPVELLFQLEGTRKELNKLQRLESQHEHLMLSSDSVAKLRDQVLNLIETRRELISEIAKYSGNTGYNPDNIMSTSDIQKKLKSDEQIVEFFWGTDSIYAISLTDQSANVTATANVSEIDSLLLAVRNMLEGQRSYSPVQVENYSLMTSRIYQQLFKPLINRKKIIVIPDESLNLIPVEALVVKHQPEKKTYKNLAYLIYDHEITYAYSSSILFHKTISNRTEIKNVLAFSYSDDSGKAGTDRQNHLEALPGTYKELETLSRIFKKVMRFSDRDALKANFISNAPEHDLIHLGVHGVGDPKVADNSRLIFRGDSLESGDLYAYDIYNLNIDARLVVLSACETGLGKRQTGEGIFSIARAFSYAGCPSVVMSMWRAADTFTASIMDGFYESLNDGNSIGSSFRASKLRFLEESDELSAHPANWAPFVLNGQDQSFAKQSTPVAIWLMLVAAGVVLTYFAVKWKRTRH